MRSDKQIVNSWVANTELKIRTAHSDIPIRALSGSHLSKMTDAHRKTLVYLKYCAAWTVVNTNLDKPINTIIALMLTNPRRFTHSTKVEKQSDIVRRGSRFTVTTTRITVTDRVTKVAFNYAYKVKDYHHERFSEYTRPERKTIEVTGMTEKESYWFRKAGATLGALRKERLAKVEKYLERRNNRETRRYLLEAYPDAE